MQAEFDTVVPPSARQDLKNELGDRVTIQVIKNAGHALIPEQAAAVAEGMDAYIKTLAGLGAAADGATGVSGRVAIKTS